MNTRPLDGRMNDARHTAVSAPPCCRFCGQVFGDASEYATERRALPPDRYYCRDWRACIQRRDAQRATAE